MLNYQLLTEKLPQINQTTYLLKMSLKKFKAFDSSYFKGKGDFEEDILKWYLIQEWESKGLSNQSIKPPCASDNSLSPLIDYLGNKIRLKFNESCLKQLKMTYTHGTIVSI